MKLIAFLAALIALAHASGPREVWPAGKEFVYEYKARVIAGIPAIKQQLTGFGIKSIVKFQVVSPNTIVAKMTELESGKVNDVVPQAAPQVYRAGPGLDWSPMSGPEAEVLKVPFKINLREGLITSLDVAEDEPTWSINIKKGLASQINVNLKQANRVPFQLRLAQKYEDKSYRHMRTPSSEDTFFAVEEDAMGGLCKTVYTVSPISNHVAIRQELDLPREILLEAASESDARPYIVTKIRDFDECDRQPSWVHMNMKDITEEPCSPANAMCHKFSTRTSVSRFLVRKSPSGEHMRVERVWGENEFIVKPHGVKTERLWSVSNQTLVLLNERPISSRIQLTNEKLTSTNLRFEFPVAEAETIEDQRLNENPMFQKLRKPHKQSIGETKAKTAEREEEKIKSGKVKSQYSKTDMKLRAKLEEGEELRQREGLDEEEEEEEEGQYGGKYGGSGKKYGKKYRGGHRRGGAGKYGSKLSEDELEELLEKKYGGKVSEDFKREAKYGYGVKRSAGYGSKGAYGSKAKRSIREEESSESEDEEQGPSPFENEDEEESYPEGPFSSSRRSRSKYDNEYRRRSFAGAEDEEEEEDEFEGGMGGGRYYESRAFRTAYTRDLRRYYPSLKKACFYTSPHSSGRIVRGASVKAQIQELIHEVVQEISEFEDLAEKESALKILQVSRACTVLSYDEILEVYHRIVSSGSSAENVKTKKTLILDAIAMAGTHPAIMVIRDLIEKGEVKGETAAQVISTIPMSVKVITPELIAELIELVQSPAVKASNQPRNTNQVWITTLLAIGNMINFGCVSPRTKNINYPKEPRGAPLCSKNDPIIVKEFIPMLQQALEKAEGQIWKKMVILHALGNTGHPAIIPAAEACITGQICRDPQVKTKAVNGLARVAHVVPSKVYKVLRPIYANQKMHYAVRMAAFQALVLCKPPPAFFSAAATDTWFEPNQQVGSFVYSTLANFANNTLPVHQNISRMARMALPLAKKYNLGAQYSRNIITSDYLPEETLGSFLRTTIFGNSKSLIPRFFFNRLITRTGGINLDLLQTGVYAQGVQAIVNKVLMAMSPAEGKEDLLNIWNQISESWHGANEEEPLGQLASELNLKVRKDDPMNVFAWFKAFGGMERAVSFDYRDLIELVSDIAPSFSSSGKMGVQMKVNYQKAFNPRSVTVILPTDVGVPVYFSKKTPVLVSIRGHIRVEGDVPSLNMRQMTDEAEVEIDLRPVVSQNVLVEMGVICPATQQSFVAGVNSHNLLSLPVKTHVKVNIPEQKLSFKIEPASGPLPQRVAIAHAHQRPFTVVRKLEDFQPVNKVASLKYMHVVAQPYENVTVIGEEVMGIPIKITSKVDRPFSPETGRYARMLKQNPVTFLSFLNVPHSLRAFEYRVTVDSARTQTKRIVGQIQLSTSAQESAVFSMEPESEVESKYYKHRSDYYSSTEQDLLSFLKNPSSFWDETDEEEPLDYTPIIGSSGRLMRSKWNKQPYRSQSKYLSRLEQEQNEEEENEEEAEIEVSTKTEGKTTVLHAEVEMQGPVPRAVRATVLACSSPDSSIQKISAQFEKEGGMHRTPYKVFATALLQSPRLPRTPLREALLQTEMTSLASVTVRFGKQAEHAVKAKVIMARTNKQRRIAEESQASKRCQADEAKGLQYSASCMRARRQATTLNKYVIDLQSENLPKGLLNATYKLDSYLKYALFPHLNLDPTARHRNPQNKIRIVLNVDSAQKSHPYPVVDILTHKPHENAFFKTVKIHPVVEAVFPLNAKTPVVEKALNNYLGWKYAPECRLGEQVIQTFDNVTVHYPLPECYHLIAKDCSTHGGMAVLAKQGPQGEKIVKIVKGEHVIVLAPTSGTSPSTPSVVVKIDGSPVPRLPTNHAHEIKKNGQVVLKIKKRTDGSISVDAPTKGIKVISDGLNVRVEASNMLRGRLCGLCGDFNGEKVAELKGPRGCVHVSPLTFGRSYAVPSEGCSSLPKVSPRELIQHLEKQQYKNYERVEEAELLALASRHIQACNAEEYEPEGESVSPRTWSRMSRRQEEEELFSGLEELKSHRRNPWSSAVRGLGEDEFEGGALSGSGMWESRSESARPCVRYVTKVVHQGDRTCFSVKPVPECNLNCKPSKLVSKMMGFHCKPTSEIADSILASARFGVLEEYLNLPSNLSSDLSIPDACELVTV